MVSGSRKSAAIPHPSSLPAPPPHSRNLFKSEQNVYVCFVASKREPKLRTWGLQNEEEENSWTKSSEQHRNEIICELKQQIVASKAAATHSQFFNLYIFLYFLPIFEHFCWRAFGHSFPVAFGRWIFCTVGSVLLFRFPIFWRSIIYFLRPELFAFLKSTINNGVLAAKVALQTWYTHRPTPSPTDANMLKNRKKM